ncbi:hypothetical protein [Breznakiella homolactica]|uniref:Uncharacterized protein n=1 Tax=Breznakiella homolactica TaxID=2798577 RepID=A0A7T7XNT5_9SPIR|nr:hypothetical protein [Breznakiella homolactica]QQO09764.1 hypothetical protein JFL75_02300 [Breznakiella homolactica]
MKSLNRDGFDPGTALALFLSRLKAENFDSESCGDFLTAAGSLPLDVPLIREIVEFTDKARDRSVPAAECALGKKIERRYRKVLFVQRELHRLDFKKASPARSFEDFIFGQTDFSAYEKISAEDFEGLFLAGMEDYTDGFFTAGLGMAREEAKTIARTGYKKDGDNFILEKKHPVVLSVMRTIHTALEFAPLLDKEILAEETGLVFDFLEENKIIDRTFGEGLDRNFRDIFACILGLFHNTGTIQADGTETRLFTAPAKGRYCLCATFAPENKAHTMVMVPSDLPFPGTAAGDSESPRDFIFFPQGRLVRDSRNRLVRA